ncbi:uncharacterized protein BYT42DRAFT_615563 [Radiomyces spectabilis]|uniref:uncharacterized protein n=1 Tax=Radiomyces spectabilis TaxID=64574 RepID=UPI002220CF1E|nr:uncharacterized protein BYT42DRAFT_615563 [Radiomyces spectabilis]KAI8374394.1 hypothetical protein BYT42DRAFT_615563 [Radiomyces spectabilis]
MSLDCSKQWQTIEYNNRLFQVAVRCIPHAVLLWSDVQALVPSATALLRGNTLVPFDTDADLAELIPRRISVDQDATTVWKVHVPATHDNTQPRQFDQLLDRLDRLILSLSSARLESADPMSPASDVAASDRRQGDESRSGLDSLSLGERSNGATTLQGGERGGASSEPDARSGVARVGSPYGRLSSETVGHMETERHPISEGDAPPSYETSILGNIKILTQKLREFENHIPNRHKSPRWLAKRSDWVEREPQSIEQVAYQLVQLEMALLWTAVTETWIDARETWLSMVATTVSERHLAGALVNLERHTLVMDDSWFDVREQWTNDLLAMAVAP